MNIEQFIKKYGYGGLSAVVAAFIRQSPEFEGDKELSTVLGEITADLESALKLYQRTQA